MTDPELHSAIGALQVGMGRIEEKVDNLRTDNERADRVHSDHEQRIRRLERWMYTLTALAAAGGSAAGSVLPRVLGG